MSDGQQNLETAKRYLQSIESGASAETISFFATDVVAQWYPHKLAPSGMTADLAALRASSERGKKLMARQTYQVRNALAEGDQVAMEIDWTGVLALPFETIPAGGEMRAHFAMFLKFRDGKVVRQSNYDCFEPW
jgi:ketosteroid isomerase-like protein